MANLWADNPDYYTDAEVPLLWTSWASANQYVRVIPDGGRRTGSDAIGWTRTSGRWGNALIQKTLFPGDSKIAFSFGFKFTYFEQVGYGVNKVFIGIGDASVWHIGIAQNADTTLAFYLGRDLGANSGGTLIGNTSWVPTLDSYVNMSIECTIHDSAGTLSCKINGAEVLNGGSGFTGIDTRNGGTAGWTRFAFYTADHFALPEPAYQFCDLVVNDGTGSVNNTHPGDCAVIVDVPNAVDGSNTSWTPNGGTYHGDRVREIPLDGDTTYLESSAVGQRETFVYPSLSISGGTIKTLINRMALKLTQAGSANAVGVMRDISGGTNYDGSVTLSPSETDYAYFDDNRPNDPATSSPWDVAGVNDTELGVKRAA